jgi:SAM-dependent methyltransferase
MLKKKYHWVIEATGKRNGVLADIGAGTGHFAKYMQDHGWQVTGLEPDETARKVALEKLDLTLLPLEKLASLKPHSFDVITLWHVLEHVQDLDGYLEHFRSILLPDGVLIIAVPNHTSVDAKHYKLQWAAYDVPRHLWHFSPGSMERLLAKHGFGINGKKAMPLDGFYVSMLSEKYSQNQVLGTVTAFINGWRSYRAGKKTVDKASSIIYIAKLKA